MDLARIAACALLVSTSACTTMKAHVMASAASDGLYAIEGFRGRVTETGILRGRPGGLVVKEVLYARPWRVRAEVLEPAEHAGELFVHDEGTVTLWWPRFFFGLRIRNVPLVERDDVEDLMLEDAYRALEAYDLRHEGAARVAGREARRWRCVPLGDEPPYRAWLDAEYHVPLKLVVGDGRGREWYGMTFDAVDFEATPPADAFRFDFPDGALVYEWDLAAPAVTLAEAQAKVEFPVLVPAELPPGHALQKVIMSCDVDNPMVALVLSSGARWLSLSEVPNMGPILEPELGLPVTIGDEPGVLNFAFGYTVLSWSVGTTALTLVGNLPYPDLLEVAASVGPPQRRTE